MASTSTGTPAAARLRRTLTLWDLILYGVIVIQPVAPMSVFGVLSDRDAGTLLRRPDRDGGDAVYGDQLRPDGAGLSQRRFRLHVCGQEIHPRSVIVTGWSMVMDYMLNPMICTVWCSQQAHVFAPWRFVWVWAVFFALVFTGLNVQGVKTSARVNTGLAAAMGVVVVIFFVAAARYVFGHPHGDLAFSLVLSTIRRCGTRKRCWVARRSLC